MHGDEAEQLWHDIQLDTVGTPALYTHVCSVVNTSVVKFVLPGQDHGFRQLEGDFKVGGCV